MEEINESGAAPEESKVQTGKGGIRQKAKHLARKTAQDWTARDVGNVRVEYCVLLFLVHDSAADHHFSDAPVIRAVRG